MSVSEKSYGRIAAIATTVTAIAAVAIAVSDNIQTRRHDRLSVVPYLILQLNLGSDSNKTTAHLTLANEGVGPAIIDSVRILLPDSARYSTWQSAQPVLQGHGMLVRGYTDFGGREAVGAGRSVNLLTVQQEKEQTEIFSYLSNMNVIITYHSIYGEPFHATLQNP